MEFFGSNSFLIILHETIKLLPKNGKIMAFIAAFSVVLSSCFHFLFSYAVQSMVVDMIVTFQQSFMPDPSSFDSADRTSLSPETGFDPAKVIGTLNHLRADFALLLVAQVAFLLAFFIISFFSSISTIIVSAVSYSAKTLSVKDLVVRMGRTWTKPLVTSFYVSGLVIAYSFIVVMLAAPLLMYPNLATVSIAILLGVVAVIFYLYLFVCWTLAIVVSVIEESCGIAALGKAAELVQGKRLPGFLLNICFNLVVFLIFQGYNMVFGQKVLANHPMIYGLVIVNVSSLFYIFLVVAYTVLYFHCKKHHGEERELYGSVQYTKLPTAQLASGMA